MKVDTNYLLSKLDNLIKYYFVTIRDNIILNSPFTTNIKRKIGYSYLITDGGGTTKIFAPRFQGFSPDEYVQVLFTGGVSISGEEKNIIVIAIAF